MNRILFRSSNSINNNNYKIIMLLILFLILKIFYAGIYPFILGNGNLYLIFKPLILYFIYYLILNIISRKNDSYYIISSLIISFIIPISIPIVIFIISSILGIIISHIFKYKINSVVITGLLISLYFNQYTTYKGIFLSIYLLLITISSLYLIINKLVKTKTLLSSFVCILIINIISNDFTFDITLFCLLFIISDNKYSPITKYSQILGGVLFSINILLFKYILNLDYYLFLSIFTYELLSIVINYFNITLYNNKICKIDV